MNGWLIFNFVAVTLTGIGAVVSVLVKEVTIKTMLYWVFLCLFWLIVFSISYLKG